MVRRFDGRLCRFVEFMIGKLAEAKDELDIDEEEETKPAASGPQYERQSFTQTGDGFMQVPDDMELPFK